ncbi:MAG: SAM-dependent methyltransferase [Lachnospiraceae bacterium]|nr:SAM-dependent methyltransferase [Lachnospiraceae bacterium]
MKKKCVQLSGRLKLIASFVSDGSRLADIGTDHGYVPIYLVGKDIIPSAIAMDINEGPLKKAEENVKMFGLEDKILLRLSDGLDKLSSKEADTVLIAGMGGRLILNILDRGKAVCDKINELILSPHSEIELVREYLMNNGFAVVREEMILDEGKYYTVMKAVHGTMEYSGMEELLYGKLLLENKDKVLKEYLLKEKSKYNDILSKLSGNPVNAIKSKIHVIDRALYRYKQI